MANAKREVAAAAVVSKAHHHSHTDVPAWYLQPPAWFAHAPQPQVVQQPQQWPTSGQRRGRRGRWPKPAPAGNSGAGQQPAAPVQPVVLQQQPAANHGPAPNGANRS
jgi:hypothetical protein